MALKVVSVFLARAAAGVYEAKTAENVLLGSRSRPLSTIGQITTKLKRNRHQMSKYNITLFVNFIKIF